MTSAINDANPTSGTATTASVRTNFTSAKDEINDLQRSGIDVVATTGTDTIVANFTNNITLVEGRRILIEAGATTTSTTPTLNVDGTGARTIVNADGSALVAGDIVAGGYYDLVYDATATEWILLNGNPLQAELDTAEADIATLQALTEYTPPNGHIDGLGFSITTDDTASDSVTVATGYCVDSTNTYDIDITTIQKNLTDAWVAGTGNGGVGTTVGTPLTADTRYKIYALTLSTDLTQYDVILSDSVANAISDAGAGFDKAEHIGYARTSSTATTIRDAWRISHPGASRQLLDMWTASSDASVDFVNDIDSTYDNYVVSFTDVVPSTTANDLSMRCGNGAFDSGASDYYTANAIINTSIAGNAGTGANANFSNGSQLSSTASNGGQSGELIIHNPADTAHTLFSHYNSSAISATNVMHSTGSFKHTKSAAMNQVQLLMNPSVGGNIASGIFKLYGIK